MRLLSPAALLLWSIAADAAVAREDIIVLDADGQHFTAYKTLRSDLPKRQVTLEADETKADLLYFHPDNYTSKQQNGRTILSFDDGSYALMRTGAFTKKELQLQNDGSYQFESWDGKVLGNGHYGKWNSPDSFARLSYVWVLPETIEILKYEANRTGEWTQRDGTLAWNGKDVNNVTFSIKYRVKQHTPLALELSQVADSTDARGLTRITLESGSLFPSGSHRFTSAGEQLLTTLADKLKQLNASQIIVEGHTDNQPLKPYLQETYPSNWELSAARATIVVRWLAEHSIQPEILEARAYGEQRPVANNRNEDGRAKNRRIEILVRSGAVEDAPTRVEKAPNATAQSAREEQDTTAAVPTEIKPAPTDSTPVEETPEPAEPEASSESDTSEDANADNSSGFTRRSKSEGD